MARLTILVALLLLGCGEEPKRFSLYGFDDAEVGVIESAAAEWCAVSSYCPLVTGGENRIELTSQDEMGDGTNGIDAAGLYWHTNGPMTPDRIQILERRSAAGWLELLRKNILHELGHAGGCGPDEHRDGTIMATDEGLSSRQITQYDIDCVR